MLKRSILLWSLLCISLSTAAQMSPVDDNYTVSIADIHFTDNSPNYTKYNLWYLMAGTPQLASFTSGMNPDGTSAYYGVDLTGNVWGHTESQDSTGFHSSWFQIPSMGTANRLIAVGHSSVWRLSTTTCTQGYQVEQWTGSAFAQWHSGCGVSLDIADLDGTAVHVNAAGNLYYSGSTGWVHPTGGGPYISAVATSSAYILANTSTGLIYRRDPGGSNTMVASGITNTPEALGRLTMGGGGTLWFLANGTGNSYVYNPATGVWIKPLQYAASYLSTSGPLNTFAVVGGNLYRFTEYGMSWTNSLDGHYNCPPTGCPPATHTPAMHLEFANGSDGPVDVTGPGVSPQTGVHITATATSHEFWTCWVNGFDPQYCLRRNNAPDGRVLCSIAGTIYSAFVATPPIGLIPIPRGEICYATFKKVSKVSGSCKTELGFVLCDYTAIPYCTAATSPPDDQPLGSIPPYYVHNMLQSSADSSTAFYHFGVCTRMTSLTGINLTNWYNPLSALPGVVSTPDVGPGVCKGPNNRP